MKIQHHNRGSPARNHAPCVVTALPPPRMLEAGPIRELVKKLTAKNVKKVKAELLAMLN